MGVVSEMRDAIIVRPATATVQTQPGNVQATAVQAIPTTLRYPTISETMAGLTHWMNQTSAGRIVGLDQAIIDVAAARYQHVARQQGNSPRATVPGQQSQGLSLGPVTGATGASSLPSWRAGKHNHWRRPTNVGGYRWRSSRKHAEPGRDIVRLLCEAKALAANVEWR